MKNDIVIAGNILADIVKIIDSYPEKGMLANISEISQAVGGCVPNTAIDFAVIDKTLNIKVFGRIGNDACGDYVLGKMKDFGIDVSSVTVSNSMSTSFTDVMTVKSTGERTFFHVRGANSEFNLSENDVESLDCKLFHIGYLLLLDELDKPDDKYQTKMSRLLKSIQEKGIKTSIDVVSEDGDRFNKIVMPALKYCNYVIINEVEAGRIAKIIANQNGKLDIEKIKQIMKKMFDYGVKDKVIIHCPEVGFCMDSDGIFTAVPSLELPKDYIKGTVGAGDAFCAGALYSLFKGYSDEKLLRFSSCAAACNLSKADSISGMKNREEIEKIETMYRRRVL